MDPSERTPPPHQSHPQNPARTSNCTTRYLRPDQTRIIPNFEENRPERNQEIGTMPIENPLCFFQPQGYYERFTAENRGPRIVNEEVTRQLQALAECLRLEEKTSLEEAQEASSMGQEEEEVRDINIEFLKRFFVRWKVRKIHFVVLYARQLN